MGINVKEEEEEEEEEEAQRPTPRSAHRKPQNNSGGSALSRPPQPFPCILCPPHPVRPLHRPRPSPSPELQPQPVVPDDSHYPPSLHQPPFHSLQSPWRLAPVPITQTDGANPDPSPCPWGREGNQPSLDERGDRKERRGEYCFVTTATHHPVSLGLPVSRRDGPGTERHTAGTSVGGGEVSASEDHRGAHQLVMAAPGTCPAHG
ncbi:unnamed protein product [Pleuronectes platessa]|uniref:Uncharacterized protein n=1 Tax=Pleuronectes platessa TaxID=8262 RepID=A0A9N7UWB1_PLEPL|nr:unnamed protein product [Pleuronectes platessa]